LAKANYILDLNNLGRSLSCSLPVSWVSVKIHQIRNVKVSW
jgi:hypothetical protein